MKGEWYEVGITMGDVTGSTRVIELQLSSLEVIANAQWTRASKLVVRFFAVARTEYERGIMDEMQFVGAITHVAALSSPDIVSTLTSYLSDLNGKAAENSFPAKPVVLAVISALGDLGDKAAFDTLLYVTYLSYPEEVVRAAREALARLKW